MWEVLAVRVSVCEFLSRVQHTDKLSFLIVGFHSILPGIFYWKISNPDSDHHQLLKDEDLDDEELGEYAGVTDTWKARLLRTGALALVIYGFAVMVTCLAINTFYVVAH